MVKVVELPPLSFSGLEVYNTIDDPEFSTNEESSDKFVALNGTITEIAYYADMLENSYDEDYEGISNTGSLSLETIDKSRLYKGKKVCLKKANDTTGKTLKWKDLETALLGFISEISFTVDGVDIKLVGMSKLLDQEKKFTFTKTKRSEILKQMIEAAGLKAKIDVTGLKDDVIDYTNVSSSGSSDVAGGQGKEIDELVAGWCEGKTSDLEKAKAIHNGLRDDVGIRYRKYYDTEYHTAANCLKHANKPGLNCGDTAILTVACMKSGGLDAYIAFRCDHAHYFTVINIGGTKYYSDLVWSEGNLSRRPFNETWENNKCIGANKGSSLG